MDNTFGNFNNGVFPLTCKNTVKKNIYCNTEEHTKASASLQAAEQKVNSSSGLLDRQSWLCLVILWPTGPRLDN